MSPGRTSVGPAVTCTPRTQAAACLLASHDRIARSPDLSLIFSLGKKSFSAIASYIQEFSAGKSVEYNITSSSFSNGINAILLPDELKAAGVNNWFGDPFIYQYSRTEIYDYSGSEVSSALTYSGSFPLYPDNWNPRSCPSEPISPSLSSCSSASSFDDTFIKVERPFPTYCREPFPQVKLEQEDFYPADKLCFASPTPSDDYSDRIGFSVETECEERYQDFLQLLSETTGFDGLGFPDLHCEVGVRQYPLESVGMRTKKSQMPRKITNTVRMASRGGSSPGSQKNSRKRKDEQQYNERSQSSSSLSGDEEGSVASRKRAKTSSPVDSYAERRAKNNTAVRKSREKKREESQRFLDEHEKLKKEVAQVKSQNERLQSLLTEVEEGLLDNGKTKDELTTLVQSAKKRLTSP